MNNKAPASTTCRGHLQGCAPGRAASLQNSRTGFKSLRPCFCRRGRTARRLPCKQDHAGSSPAVGFDAPLECDGRHATLRRSKTRFDSWRGHCAPSPRVWRTHGGLRSRKAGFDSRAGDSERSCSDRCPRSVTDSHTTLRRSRTRFNSWRGHGSPTRVEALKAPEPDGQAAVCKTAEVGSTPTGVSHRLPRRSPLVVHPHGPKSSTWPLASVAANSWHRYAG